MPEPPDVYDYLIVGGGAAGLSLAWHLAHEPRLKDKKILLIEPDLHKPDDRAWRYWAAGPTPFAAIERHRYGRFRVQAPGFAGELGLAPYQYRVVRAGDYYAHVGQALAARPGQFERRTGRVQLLTEDPAGPGALATLEGGPTVRARYAFDSRPPELRRRPDVYRYLQQHFLGWEIEADHDAFDPDTVQFMDFDLPQREQVRFVYTLPASARRALVEFTVFSENLLEPAEYEAELRAYLARRVGTGRYRVLSQESGSIPMTDHPARPRPSPHVLTLGTRAGRAKPSTGYTFARIHRHSARLVAALAATGHPPADPTGDSWQFRFFDALLLDIMQRQGEAVAGIFGQLFARNPVPRILRFLDEETTWLENLQIMNSVTPGPFLKSIGNVVRGRAGRRGP